MILTLTATDFGAISPLLILLGGALVILALESFVKEAAAALLALMAFLTISAATAASFFCLSSDNTLLSNWLRFDSMTHWLTLFFLAIGLAVTLLSATFFERFVASRGEYFFLLLCSLIGLILMAQAADFLILFLGIETLSISLYILCGYMKNWNKSHEAAFKYFLMGSVASAFLLYGIALVYGALGTTRLDALLSGYQNLNTSADQTLFLSGIALITLSLAFKATIVPFHIWAPDVYSGAPTPITAFMAVGTKVGVFAVFMRIFLQALPNFTYLWSYAIAALAILTLLYANIVALRQFQLRRFFAYSGMSHAGFLLLPLAAGMPEAQSSMIFYLMIYGLATFGCFAILAIVDSGEEETVSTDLRGLFHRDPLSGLAFTVCLLNLAGIPPMAGFLAKFYLFKVTFEAGYQVLVIIALLSTILSAAYYLRIISTIFLPAFGDHKLVRSRPATVLACTAVFCLVLISFYPVRVPFVAIGAPTIAHVEAPLTKEVAVESEG